MAESVDNSLTLEILKEVRKDLRDVRAVVLLTSEAVHKLHQLRDEDLLAMKRGFLDVEERMKAHKDDMEMMLKAELLGALTNFQNKIEIYVDQRLAERAE